MDDDGLGLRYREGRCGLLTLLGLRHGLRSDLDWNADDRAIEQLLWLQMVASCFVEAAV